MPIHPRVSIYLGFDPGGDQKFGVAFPDGDCVSASIVSNVDDAMKWADSACRSRLPVAGIDTLLHWATSKPRHAPLRSATSGQGSGYEEQYRGAEQSIRRDGHWWDGAGFPAASEMGGARVERDAPQGALARAVGPKI
jgi:hypothetical protein